HQATRRLGMRRKFGDILAVEQNPAAPRTQAAHGGAQRGGFAGAVGADDGGQLAGPHLQRYAPKYLHFAVAGFNAVQLEGNAGRCHCAPRNLSTISGKPRYASTTSGFCTTSSGGASAILRPRFSTTMRSERFMMACITCSIMNTETPRSRMLRTRSII